MKRIAATLLIAAGFAALPDPARPAQAQAMFEGCVVHDFHLPIRSRFVYRDWQGVEHTSGWVQGIGIRNCPRWQDLQSIRVETQRPALLGDWVDSCGLRFNRTSGRPVVLVSGRGTWPVCTQTP